MTSGPSAPPRQKRHPGLLVALLGVVGAMFAVGVAVLQFRGGAEASASVAPAIVKVAPAAAAEPIAAPERVQPIAASAAESTDSTAAVSSGQGDVASGEGAVRAAVHMLELGEPIVSLTPVEAAELQATIAAEATREQLGIDAAAHVQNLQSQLPLTVVPRLRVAAIESRLDAISERAATVSIWYVGIFTVPEQSVTSFWRTVTYELVWERDAWRELSSTSVDGPTPATPVGTVLWAPEALEAALDEFNDGSVLP